MRFRRNRSKQREGASAVEFAFVAPVVLILIFGMVELSRFMMALHATAGAAREATRAAVVTGATESEVRDVALNFMTVSFFRTDSLTVDIDRRPSASVAGMDTVTCTVTIAFADVSVIGDPFSFLNTVENVSGRASMLTNEL